jgi:hypothetical protein
MKHLIIHVKDHVNRKELIEQNLANHIEWKFFDAVEYKNFIDSKTNLKIKHQFVRYGGDSGERILTPADILDTKTNAIYKYIPANNLETEYKPYNIFLSEQQISLALSHINAIKYFFETNDDDVFVLCEDDVKINPSEDPIKFYNELLQLEFDICILCESPGYGMNLPLNKQISDKFFEVKPHWYSGAAGYCIKRSCYDIIKDIEIVSFAADDLFGILQVDCECKIIASNSPLFALNELSKYSTIN